ncbi:MAG: MBL fold metallo-hydrolase [Candidatus Izemoplasma sp.]
MKITTLLENGTLTKNLKSAHGLSVYIEYKEKKILFDLGPNNYYLKNAKKLGIDLSEVDYLIISHGHFDHGNGLAKFLKLNKKAQVYVSSKAFEKHYKEVGFVKIPIGIKKPKDAERLVFVDSDIKIEDGINLFSNVDYIAQVINDSRLTAKTLDGYGEDHFNHEIYLVLSEDNNRVLLSGCSHKGIKHIMDSIEKRKKYEISHVIGGFHLSHYDDTSEIHNDYLKELGSNLLNHSTSKYFSCHCTGDKAFDELKKQMNHKLERIMTGSIINI